tara:strand:- start:1011 stop:1370 length:360 start_codon:yes stop_codon:yes gene_type:complete
MSKKCSMTIFGNVPSKSNQYRIARGRMYKSKELKVYEDSFAMQCKEYENLMIEGHFRIKLKVFYPSRRSDLDNALKVILDCCQHSKIIKNDNRCIEIIAYKEIDKEQPRIEFEIEEFAI